MRRTSTYAVFAAASLLLAPQLAAAADLEVEIADMKQRMEVMEDQLRAQTDDLAEAKATGEKARWNTAYGYWNRLGQMLARGRPRPVQYYEVQYHVALALQALRMDAQATQVLKGVMTLSPAVGTPEWKAKYQELLAQLGR